MKKIPLRPLLLGAALMLSVILLAGCEGVTNNMNIEKAPNINDYYSSQELMGASADIALNGYKYTMYGPYFVYFQGAYYRVEFDNSRLKWIDAPTEELFFVEVNEFYSDKKLNKRCCYSGAYVEERPLLGDRLHDGYLLDGSRPKMGAVLYLDETKVRRFYLPGSDHAYGPDDILKADGPMVYKGVVLADENGVFKEELNTPRKIYRYFMEKDDHDNVAGTNIAYPEIFSVTFVPEQLGNGKRFDRFTDVTIGASAPSLQPMSRIRLVYPDSNLPVREFYVYENEAAAADLLAQVQAGEYEVLEKDDRNRPTKVRRTGGTDEVEICYSRADFNRLLEEENLLDMETRLQVAHYSLRQGDASAEYHFDGKLHYLTDETYIRLYAIWETGKVVTLHAMEQEILIGVGKKGVTLPAAPVQPGMEFVGWYKNQDFDGQPVTNLSAGDTAEHLYARYREVEFYTLTLEPYNGQTFDTIQYRYGDTVELPSLYKSFYIFKGWCIDAECKTEPMRSVTAEFFGSYHLYPCFEAREYTLTLMLPDSVITVGVRYGEEYVLPTEELGAGFLGYFDQNGQQYTDANGHCLAPFTDGADIQLFAKFKEE